MHDIFHILGLCPDNLSHLDILDLIMYNYNGFITTIKNIIFFRYGK